MEGPFGEYPGYAGGTPSPKPTLEVTCITHRDGPIMRGTLEGCRPGFPSEDSILCSYSWSAIFWNMLEAAGVVGVTDVWCPHVSTGTHIVVQIRKQYRGHAQQVAMALWGTSAAQWFFKHVLVVEEDIDIRDPLALEWAIAFRVNAGMDQVMTFGPTFGSPLDPSVSHDVLDMPRFRTGKWTRVLVDATRNWELAENEDLGRPELPAGGQTGTGTGGKNTGALGGIRHRHPLPGRGPARTTDPGQPARRAAVCLKCFQKNNINAH